MLFTFSSVSPLEPLAITNLLTVSIVLPFPKLSLTENHRLCIYSSWFPVSRGRGFPHTTTKQFSDTSPVPQNPAQSRHCLLGNSVRFIGSQFSPWRLPAPYDPCLRSQSQARIVTCASDWKCVTDTRLKTGVGKPRTGGDHARVTCRSLHSRVGNRKIPLSSCAKASYPLLQPMSGHHPSIACRQW